MYLLNVVATISWLAVIVVVGPAGVVEAAGGLPRDANPLICPDTQPISFEGCATPTATGSSCDYGEICCPGEGGKCVAKTACVCSVRYGDGEKLTWDCKNDVGYGNLPCQSVCPEVPPTRPETCLINEAFECAYGKELVCEDATGSSFKQNEISCVCSSDSASFSCDRNPCPVPCPAAKPNDGDSCSAPFMTGTCTYAGELCCPGEEGKCIQNQICDCNSKLFVTCYEDESDAGLPCPSVCPIVPPNEDDPCDIDSRYVCGYGDAVVCDNPAVSSEYEKVCRCDVNGTFSCEPFACPVPCPEPTLVVEGAPCSPFLSDDGYCNSGEFCCPEEGGECLPEKKCRCVSVDGVLTTDCEDPGYSRALLCPSVCPETPPVDDDFCDIDNRFNCAYGDPVICEWGTGIYFSHTVECSCFNNTFLCTNNTEFDCTEPCPETQPIEGDECSGYLQPGEMEDLGCDYGELCCPGEGGKCIPDLNCICTSFQGIRCRVSMDYASLPCPSVCPQSPPETNDVCDIDRRYECRYGGPLPCEVDFLGYSAYEKQCYCENGKFICESHSCPPVACPETQPVNGDVCSVFVGDSCNYIQQPCCVEGGGDGVPCVANSTCFCDKTEYTVKCNELPIVFCPTQGNVNNGMMKSNNMNSKKKASKKSKKVKSNSKDSKKLKKQKNKMSKKNVNDYGGVRG